MRYRSLFSRRPAFFPRPSSARSAPRRRVSLVGCVAALWCTAAVLAQPPVELPTPAGAADRKAPRVRPDSAEKSARDEIEAAYQFALAKLLVEEAAFEKAVKSYEKALELDAADPYSHLEYARFSSYMGQIASGQPKEQLEHLEKAVRATEAARALAPENLDVLRTFAQIHLQIGRYRPESLEVARQAYEELHQKTEGDLQVLTSLGQLYLWRREPAKAAAVLEEASRFLPNHRTISAMLVESLLAAEQPEKAEAAIGRLLDIDPSALEYRLQLATLLSERGAHDAAIKVLGEAPPALLDNPQLRRQLARELYLSGENERALETIDGLLANGPGSGSLRRLRVAILDSLVRFDEALEDFLPLLDAQPASARPLQDVVLASRLLERLGRGEEAAEWLRTHVASHPPEEARQLRLILAGTLERNDRIDEAAAEIRALMADATSTQRAFLSQALSETYLRDGRVDEAIGALTSSAAELRQSGDSEAADRLLLLQLMTLAEAERWQDLLDAAPALIDSEHEELREGGRLFHARALAKLGRLDDALGLLDAAQVTEANRRRALVERVQLLFEHERDAEAERQIAEIVQSGEADDRILAARILQRSGRYAEAIPILEKLVAERPESSQVLFMLGVSLERSGQHEAAISRFESLIALEPEHSDALNYLGYMLAERGERLDEALRLLHQANALDTDNGAFVDSLGWAYYQLGDTGKARQHLEWAARLIPEDPTIFEHLGDLYQRIEETELALDAYRRAISLGADDEDRLQRKLEALESPKS